jgi:hypothetical protein
MWRPCHAARRRPGRGSPRSSHGAFVGVERIAAQRVHALGLAELAGNLAAIVLREVPGGVDRATQHPVPREASAGGASSSNRIGRRLRGLRRRPRRTGDRVTRRAQCVVLVGLGAHTRGPRAGAGPRRYALSRRGFAWVPGAARAGNASRENGPFLPIRPWPVDALTMRSTPTPAPPQGPCGGGHDVWYAIVTWWNIAGLKRQMPLEQGRCVLRRTTSVPPRRHLTGASIS